MTEKRIDWRQLKALLRAYFIISTRAMPVGVTGAKRMRTLPIILAIYTALGFFIGATAALFPVFLFAFFVHMMTLFIVGSMALNEASEILFNSRDGEILQYRPVHASTLVLAKGSTLFGFSGLMALAMNIGPCALGALAKDARGWFALVHLASVLLETSLVCAAVLFAHGLIVRYLGAERFQRFVTAAQIFSTILLIVGFQILPRIANRIDLSIFEGVWNPVWWLPPTWFAAFDGWLAGTTDPGALLLPALVGIGLTLVLAWFAVLRLPRVVARNVQEEARPAPPVASEGPRTAAAIRPQRTRYDGAFWRAWMPDPLERAIFRLTATQLKRDRSLKVRLAAGLAYFLVLPFLFVLDHKMQRMPNLPFFLVWMCSIIPLSALEFLRVSAVPDSAELFLFSPIADPSALLHGARKAALTFVVIPLLLYMLVVAVCVSHSDLSALWVALPPLVLVHPMSMVPGWRGDYIPFSQAVRAGERSAQVLGMFLSMIPLFALGGLVALAHHFGRGIPAVIFVCVVAVVLHVLLRNWIRQRARFALKR